MIDLTKGDDLVKVEQPEMPAAVHQSHYDFDLDSSFLENIDFGCVAGCQNPIPVQCSSRCVTPRHMRDKNGGLHLLRSCRLRPRLALRARPSKLRLDRPPSKRSLDQSKLRLDGGRSLQLRSRCSPPSFLSCALAPRTYAPLVTACREGLQPVNSAPVPPAYQEGAAYWEPSPAPAGYSGDAAAYEEATGGGWQQTPEEAAALATQEKAKGKKTKTARGCAPVSLDVPETWGARLHFPHSFDTPLDSKTC